jgi:hypothetical protein
MRKNRIFIFFTAVFICTSFFSFSAEVITSDINNDGDVDGWTYLRNGKVEKQEIDMNFDGKIDTVYIYEGNGKVKEEILDTDYDGKMDNWRKFDDGELMIDSVDSDSDGKADLWIYVDRERIYKIERDTTGDGKPDKVAEYYD